MTQESLPIFNMARCNFCGTCVTVCPVNALLMTDLGPQFNSPNPCTYCSDCEDVCPEGAIRTPLTVTWGPEN